MIACMGSATYPVVVYFECAEASSRCELTDAVLELAGVSSDLHLDTASQSLGSAPTHTHSHT